jgi:hypothetical protein
MRHCKGSKMTQKWGTVTNYYIFYRKTPITMPHPFLHPFLAPSSLVLTNGRCTQISPCPLATWLPGNSGICISIITWMLGTFWSFLQKKSNSEWVNQTLRLHRAAARWNALCTVLLSLRRLETTALLQGKFPCSAAWLGIEHSEQVVLTMANMGLWNWESSRITLTHYFAREEQARQDTTSENTQWCCC